MSKKLTMNELARPLVVSRDLAEGYRAMAADREREAEASQWVENLTGDIATNSARSATCVCAPESAG